MTDGLFLSLSVYTYLCWALDYGYGFVAKERTKTVIYL